jgi:hypothetical protein
LVKRDVIAGKRWPGYGREDRAGLSPEEARAEHEADFAGLGDGFIADVMASPLPWIGVGAVVWYAFFRTRR